MLHIRPVRILASLVLIAASHSAAAASIAYIASSGGYMLHGSGGATLAKWQGQAPISFSGYGQIKQGGNCLSGSAGGQQLRWEGCRSGDKGQIWALNGSKLNNELGFCADVERGHQAAGTRVLAYQCNGGSNQQWRGLAAQSGQSVASGISNVAARNTFLNSLKSAPAGAQISTATGQVIAPGSATGGYVVSAGGGNVVAAGGLN